MPLHGFSVPEHSANQKSGTPRGFVMATCSRCEQPSVFHVDMGGSATWAGVVAVLENYNGGSATRNLSATDYRITQFEQRPVSVDLPAHLPDDVTKALAQAETNFAVPDHEEAAATMYRRALERAIKSSYPDLTGTLASKIKSLVQQGTIPAALGDWADQIRLVGNDGAHDGGVTPEDLKAARSFCDAFLRYLITLPKEVEIRRGLAT